VGLSVKIRWFLLIAIIIMGIAYKPLSLFLIPLLIYRETRDWLIDGLYSLIFPGLAPRLEVLDDYVFDYQQQHRPRLLHGGALVRYLPIERFTVRELGE